MSKPMSPASRIRLAADTARVARAQALYEGINPVRARAVAMDAAELARSGHSPSRAIRYAIELGGAWMLVRHGINGEVME